jgi:PEP-CTERM motif
MKKSILITATCILLALGASGSAFAVLLTSVTLDPESSTGATTNAPGAFSTNTGDPLGQIGVASGGTFLNSPGPGFDLGEISINLQPGIDTFDLYGNTIHPGNPFYGVVLFFDGAGIPQVAVFNSNGGTGSFSIQPAGNTIIGSATGGCFFCLAPGTDTYSAPDGSTVKVIGFTVDSINAGTDLISVNNIGPNGVPDTVAHLSLEFTPASIPEPASILLLGIGIASILGFKRR